MSRVSRTTLEKRQLLTIIGAGAGKEGTIVSASGADMHMKGGSAASITTATSQPMAAATAAVGGCGCEAFAPIADASEVAFSDGSFPAFLQTACLVTYRDAEAAKAQRQHEAAVFSSCLSSTSTSGGGLGQSIHASNGGAAANGSGSADGEDVEPQSPIPQAKETNNNGGEGRSSSVAAPLSYGSSSPVRRDTTLNPASPMRGVGALAARASSQPIYVPDDTYDQEVDAHDAREARKSTRRAASVERKASLTRSLSEEAHGSNANADGSAEKATLVNGASNDLISEVWTAEADGTISVRNPTSGRHAKGQPRIPSFGKLSHGSTVGGGGYCYVTALIHVRHYVFAGYVDGMVRAFDVVTKELVFEKRKHASAVTALAQWKENIVFSASDDFRIMMWRVGIELPLDAKLRAKRKAAEAKEGAQTADGTQLSSPTHTTAVGTGAPVLVVNVPRVQTTQGSAQLTEDLEGPSFLHQLLGHASRVHALHVEGDYLFSGGDEGHIKCWDIRARTEVTGKGRYPIVAHPNGGVRDITSCQTVLITAGKGGVCLYDIETCEEMKRFTNYADVNRIMVDPTSLVLWVCCSNTGTVTLIDLYTFREIGVIADFSAATIKTIIPVATSPAARLFLGAKGNGLSVAYCEGGATGMRTDYSPINAATEAKYKTLDVLRDEIFANEANLESYRSLLWSIRDTDHYHKHKAALILAQGTAFQQQKSYLERCILYVIKQRHCSRQMTIATALARGCDHRLRFTALLKWFLFRRGARDARFKEFVTNSLAKEHERQLIGRQLQNVMTYMVNAQRLRTRRLIAPILENYQVRRCIIGFFIKWRRWVQEKRANSRRDLVVGYLHNRAHHQSRLCTYRKLSSNVEDAHLKTLYIAACVGMERTNKSLLLRRFYQAWVQLRLNKRRALQRVAMSRLVADHYEVPLRRAYYNKLWANASLKLKAKSEQSLHVLNDRIEFMTNMINKEAIASGKPSPISPASPAAQKKPAEAEEQQPAATDAANESGSGETEVDVTAPIATPNANVPTTAAAANDDGSAEILALDEEIAQLEREVEEANRVNAAIKASVKELSGRETRLLAAAGIPLADIQSHKAIPKRRAVDNEEFADVGANEGVAEVTNSALNSPRSPLSAEESFSDAFRAGESEQPFGDGANASDYARCDAAVDAIKCSGFNLRTARAEIARRHKKPAGSSKSEAPTAAFAAAINNLFTAVKPLAADKGEGLLIDDAWAVDEAKFDKPVTLKKVVGPAHDVVVAWEYIRNLRKKATAASATAATNGSAVPFTEDIPHLDVFARNIGMLNTIFGKSLGDSNPSSPFGSPTADRTTPLQTPTGSRNASPNPARRSATPSRSSRTVTGASPAVKKPAGTATPLRATRSATPSKTVGSGATAKRPATATTTATKAAAPSATRATSPSVSRPLTAKAKTTTTTAAPTAAKASTATAAPKAKTAAKTPAPPASASTVKKSTTAASTTAGARPTTPRAGAAAAASTTTSRRSATPTGSTAAASPLTKRSTSAAASKPATSKAASSTKANAVAK